MVELLWASLPPGEQNGFESSLQRAKSYGGDKLNRLFVEADVGGIPWEKEYRLMGALRAKSIAWGWGGLAEPPAGHVRFCLEPFPHVYDQWVDFCRPVP